MSIRMSNVNNEAMKKINLSLVLNAIWENEPISRRDLAKLTGLTPSSITNIIKQLMRDGVLIETGVGESNGGRKPVMLHINGQSGYIIGIELTFYHITGIMVDMRAKKVGKLVEDTRLKDGKEAVIGRIIDVIDKLINDVGIKREKVLGIGISAPGPYDHERGVLINPPNFPGWHNVPIVDIIQSKFNIPTYLEKETQAAALAEWWFGGAKNCDSLFAISINKVGLGGGMIINGEVYHGFFDGAGDLGHMIIDMDGVQCTCGSYGCLEAMATGLYIQHYVVSEIKRGRKSSIYKSGSDADDIEIDAIFEAANSGDPLCMEALDKAAYNLGIGIGNIINVCSPDVIVIGGEIPALYPQYVQKAVITVHGRAYPGYNKDVRILPATFGQEMGAIGAISLVFHNIFKILP
ncbi:ROK family transcriptional regulator [Mahella australiensis]|uniref:ROK family protein n=1 Tax=Mahella australiensis (strain DSM 15567 / CIP 107919 / 50-1 BON) TaxID=697281 RepID=F4A162_MAHA5|nr:ROK family transcriptional regulator [Mahella australiensis]AEE95965.1 ROK family protein [Mahella australiensis 50-1 BON]